MKKKLFKCVPIPSVSMAALKEIANVDRGTKGVIVSQVKKVYEKKTLILNVYQVSGKNRKDISLSFRVFCQEQDYITYDVEGDKWRSGSLLNLICRDSGWCEYWWSYGQLEFASDTDKARTNKVLAKWVGEKISDDTNNFHYVDRYQSKIKEERLAKKHKKVTDVIDLEMEKFGDIPNDYDYFVENVVFGDENYIFYNTKEKRAFCTRCKFEYILQDKHLIHKTVGIWNKHDEVYHNHTVSCPHCGKLLKCKSEGMSRRRLMSIGWSVLVQNHGEEVLTRYFLHTKDFSKDFHNPPITSCELYRTVHSKETVKDFMWATFDQTYKYRWCYYREQGNNWTMPSEMVCPRTVTLYNTNMQEAIDGTCMQYSVPDIFFEKVVKNSERFKSPWIVDNYFNSYRVHPFLEQLLKVGFYKIVSEYLENYRYSDVEFYDGEKSILGTLGVNKTQFNMLRKIGNPRIKDIEILRYKPDLKWNDFEEVRYIQDNGWSDMYKKYIDFMKYTTLHKLKRYIQEQKIVQDKDYFDYAEWIEEMGYDMKNEFNLFPKNFKNAHDEMSKQYLKFKDKKAREEVRKFNKILKKLQKETEDVEAMNLELNDLFIRLPRKLSELKTEGENLHHCVGTYITKVSKGETMIFFIRKKSDPDKSYYTMEWHGNVVQCRGSHNCDMTPEVKAFVAIFEKKMAEYEKEPVKQMRKVG